MFNDDGLHSAGVCPQATCAPESAQNAATTMTGFIGSPQLPARAGPPQETLKRVRAGGECIRGANSIKWSCRSSLQISTSGHGMTPRNLRHRSPRRAHIIARHTMLRTMRPFILPGTILLAAGLTVLPAKARQDTA